MRSSYIEDEVKPSQAKISAGSISKSCWAPKSWFPKECQNNETIFIHLLVFSLSYFTLNSLTCSTRLDLTLKPFAFCRSTMLLSTVQVIILLIVLSTDHYSYVYQNRIQSTSTRSQGKEKISESSLKRLSLSIYLTTLCILGCHLFQNFPKVNK